MDNSATSFGNAYEILLEKLQTWYELLVSHLPNAVAALVTVAAFYVLASIGRRIGQKVFERAFDTGAIAQLVSMVLKVAILVTGIFIGLGVLGLQKTVLSLLAGAGIMGIAIGFAFQDLAENFIAGIVMGIRKPFQAGDLIETHNELGHVESLNLRNSILVNFSGQRIIIPNKKVFQNKLINYSQTGSRRIEIEVGVAFDTDIERATKIAKDSINEKCAEWLLKGKDVDAFALKFEESSVAISIRYWIQYPGDKSYFSAIHDGTRTILKAFRENDINIPFPIRTLLTANERAITLPNPKDEPSD